MFKPLDDHIRDWAMDRVQVDERWSIKLRDLFRAFQAESDLPHWPEGYSVRPNRFTRVMRRLFPDSSVTRSNGTKLNGVAFKEVGKTTDTV